MASETFEIVFVSKGDRVVQRNIRNIGKSAKRTTSFLGALRAALVIVASVRIGKGLTDLADQFTNVGNRLKLVTNNTEELTVVQKELFRISQETRTSFEANATIFNRLARSTLNLGLTFQELLDITQGLGQAIAVSGAQSQEAKNALIQFSQGLAAGALTGDELRSVVEQLPALADAIGAEFGKSGGELIAFAKAAGNDRILGLERVIRGVQKALPGFAKQFAQLTPTIESAFVVFNNAIVQFIGNIEQSTSAASTLARFIIRLANNLDIVAEAVLAVAAGFGALFTLKLVGIILRTAAAIITLRGGILGLAKTIATISFFGLAAGATALRNELVQVNDQTTTLGNLFKGFGVFAKQAVVAVADALKDNLNKELKDGKSLSERFAQVLVDGFKSILDVVIDTTVGIFRLINIIKVLASTDLASIFDGIKEVFNKRTESGMKAVGDGISSIINTVTLGLVDLGRSKPAVLDADILLKGGKALITLKDRLNEVNVGAEELRKNLRASVKETITTAADDTALDRAADLLAGEDLIFNPGVLSNKPRGKRSTGDEDAAPSKAFLKAEKAIRALEGSISPLLQSQNQLIEQEKIINDALEQGIGLRITKAELLKRLTREQLGVDNANVIAAETAELLNRAHKNEIITLDELNQKLRENRITQLEASREAGAGFERAFLKLQDSASDAASVAEELFSKAFGAAEDALVSFVQTGKVDIASLAKDFSAFFLRLGLQQAAAFAGGAFGFGNTRGGGGGAGGLGGIIAGGISSLFKAQNGASFTVGPNSAAARLQGVDNRLIAFRAQDGERVDVTPRNSGGPTGQPTNIVFNVQTKDADSFKRSQTQLTNRAAASLFRARSRR